MCKREVRRLTKKAVASTVKGLSRSCRKDDASDILDLARDLTIGSQNAIADEGTLQACQDGKIEMIATSYLHKVGLTNRGVRLEESRTAEMLRQAARIAETKYFVVWNEACLRITDTRRMDWEEVWIDPVRVLQRCVLGSGAR